jgi:hypothetical protein
MGNISGTLINLWVRDEGTTQWKQIVCTEDSTFTINSEVSKRRTNCGIRTSVADPEFTATGNAVSDSAPTSAQADYNYIKVRIKAKQIQEFRYYSDADSANGVSAGYMNNYGNGYFVELGAAASAEADGLLTFSFTFEGHGTLDDYASEAIG